MTGLCIQPEFSLIFCENMCVLQKKTFCVDDAYMILNTNIRDDVASHPRRHDAMDDVLCTALQ